MNGAGQDSGGGTRWPTPDLAHTRVGPRPDLSFCGAGSGIFCHPWSHALLFHG